MEFGLTPTLVYILLMVGLWLAATSFFVPGTGIFEVFALAVLGGTLYTLISLPTNWSSVVLLVLSVSVFILLPLVRPKLTHFAEIALVGQGVSSLFLFNGLRVNLMVIALLVVISFVYNRFLLVPLMHKMREAPSVGNETEQLVGALGRITVKVIPPNAGTAYINGETWTVRSHEVLDVNDTVIVNETRGLEAIVEKVKAKHQPQPDDADQA